MFGFSKQLDKMVERNLPLAMTGFAYQPKKQVDGIVVCRCPVPLGSQCSYHSKIVNLKLWKFPM